MGTISQKSSDFDKLKSQFRGLTKQQKLICFHLIINEIMFDLFNSNNYSITKKELKKIWVTINRFNSIIYLLDNEKAGDSIGIPTVQKENRVNRFFKKIIYAIIWKLLDWWFKYLMKKDGFN